MGLKARLELVALALFFFFGLVLRYPALLLLGIPLAVHLVVGLSLVPPAPSRLLLAEREVSRQRLAEGEVLEVGVKVVNQGRRPLEVIVEDALQPGWEMVSGERRAARSLQPKEALELRYAARVRRGLYQLSEVLVEVRDPLGLAPWRGTLPCPAKVVAFPRWEKLLRLNVPPNRTLIAAGTAPARRGGEGVEFFGVREFRPGDEVRRLNWKALARTGELVVTEFAEERAAEVAVILDVRAKAYQVHDGNALLDHAARAAAALAQHHLRLGHRVGLLQYGAYLDWVLPGYGRRHGEKLLWELARARLGESEVFADLSHLPTRLLPAGSLILFVSPLLLGDEETLGRLVARGYRVVSVMPDPASAERGEVTEGPETDLALRILELERWALLRRLHKAGVTVVVWDVRRPLSPLLRTLRPMLRRVR